MARATIEQMRASLLAHNDRIHRGDLLYWNDERNDYVDYLEGLYSYDDLMEEATEIIKYYAEYLGEDDREDHPNLDAIEDTIAWITRWSLVEVAA